MDFIDDDELDAELAMLEDDLLGEDEELNLFGCLLFLVIFELIRLGEGELPEYLQSSTLPENPTTVPINADPIPINNGETDEFGLPMDA